ncbi:uncharacterized protein SAPINGB_P005865 [Magnusiomyces paraingens]|uniref:tRNA-splicing endonuclease subunit Sen15 domain-containing protein n=1 Tax=Magnusiomyces paraingens TaxID=2606893 RepID=A0A5E8C1L3_9ASCO|nr:uncharacterized protein SAPINGB_P005865 [Saprochaete ingens]VVT57779.1 unnamed protein product [Saprochaete ingens]
MTTQNLTRQDLEEESKYLADLVFKNLRYQQLWTKLETHKITLPIPDSSSSSSKESFYHFTIVSGTPPEKLHHDDPTFTETQQQYTEWVLPSVTEQKWSIREWVQVFNQVELLAQNLSNESLSVLPSVRRMVMACQTNDGTVVYYMINKGIVPPKRN